MVRKNGDKNLIAHHGPGFMSTEEVSSARFNKHVQNDDQVIISYYESRVSYVIKNVLGLEDHKRIPIIRFGLINIDNVTRARFHKRV
mgnify:CR=1 FL=1